MSHSVKLIFFPFIVRTNKFSEPWAQNQLRYQFFSSHPPPSGKIKKRKLFRIFLEKLFSKPEKILPNNFIIFRLIPRETLSWLYDHRRGPKWQPLAGPYNWRYYRAESLRPKQDPHRKIGTIYPGSRPLVRHFWTWNIWWPVSFTTDRHIF